MMHLVSFPPGVVILCHISNATKIGTLILIFHTLIDLSTRFEIWGDSIFSAQPILILILDSKESDDSRFKVTLTTSYFWQVGKNY